MGYVYKITNTVNNKSYIGISVNEPEKDRIQKHLSGKGNRVLANAVKKYGKDAFTYEVLEANVFDEFLPDLEVAYIANCNTIAPHGYNLTHGGDNHKKLSADTRRKMSEAHKGKKNHQFGRRHSVSTRRKMSEAHKGKKLSTEARRKMSETRKGRKHSTETRRKISEAKKGRKHSIEARRKMSEAHKGKKGKPRSVEHQRKISEAKRLPEYAPAHKFFLSLPADMPLREKRKLLYTKFSNVTDRTIRKWVQKWKQSD